MRKDRYCGVKISGDSYIRKRKKENGEKLFRV